jgi:fructose-1,6-bisphosphatase/inositol monophosphatase family enzyme
MKVIRPFQLGLVSIQELEQKGDSTLLSAVDLASEAAAKDVLSARFPEVPIIGEEGGLSSVASHRYRFMVDPIDGTRPFLNGSPSSTVITSLFNHESGRFEATTIAEPVSGRLWTADGARNLRTIIDVESGEPVSEPVATSTWDGDFRDNGTVLIDHMQAFSRQSGKRPILGNADVVRLFGGLQDSLAINSYGSNGLHHALVANGGARMAGAITTAMGGEWDTAGAVNVLSAGGVAEGFRMSDDRALESADPLEPYSYDMLVTANNQETLDFLRNALRHAVRAA